MDTPLLSLLLKSSLGLFSLLVSHPSPPSACPHTLTLYLLLSWAGRGCCPSAPGHCPICSWPLRLESQLSPGREPSTGHQPSPLPPACPAPIQALRGHHTSAHACHKHHQQSLSQYKCTCLAPPGPMNQSQRVRTGWCHYNDVPKGRSMVTSKDTVREAALRPGLQEALRAQTHSALSTSRSPAPGEPPLSGRTEVGAGVVSPGGWHRSRLPTFTTPEGRGQHALSGLAHWGHNDQGHCHALAS